MMLTPLVIMPRIMVSNAVDGMAWAALSDIGLTYEVFPV